jgi:hypothetical protein
MNADRIFQSLHEQRVDYLLIGGMNFLLRHAPELTFDVDIWVRDDPDNLAQLHRALRSIGAAWGPSEHSWAPLGEDYRWLQRQTLFCLTTNHGAVDVFREVRGLEGRYAACRAAAQHCQTATGVPFVSLSDEDMLQCQLALPESERKPRRVEILREAIRRKSQLDP